MATMRTPPAGSQSGFTLAELLVVLLLLALMAAFIPWRPVGGGAEAKLQLRQLVAELRQTRAQAIRENRTIFHMLAVDGWPPEVTVVLHTTADQRLAEQAGSIRFYPDGSSSGGGLDIRRGAGGWRVSVDWLTGEVGLRDLEQGR